MEKTNKNFWLGILVHNKCKKIIFGKINGELIPSEVKDAEDWFIRSA